MRADLYLDGSRREEEEFKGCQQPSTSEVMVNPEQNIDEH